MRICLAQTRPIKGDVERNIEGHKKFIEQAVAKRAGMVVFPELSITGYEPALAKDLATTKDDHRFDDFQKIADARGITIGVAGAAKTLSEIARKYAMTVLMCNCVGPCDNFEAAGGTAFWNDKGALVEQLDNSSEGILMIDTDA